MIKHSEEFKREAEHFKLASCRITIRYSDNKMVNPGDQLGHPRAAH